MKISVITLQNVRNYGSALQALATQQFLQDLGCEVELLDYYRVNMNLSPLRRAAVWCEGMNIVKKLIYSLLLIPTFMRQNVVFPRFLRDNINKGG